MEKAIVLNRLLVATNLKKELFFATLDSDNNFLQYKAINCNSLLNNVYVGIIEKVDHSINAIFVQLSSNQNGFLSFNDLVESDLKDDNNFSKKYIKGQKILVQVKRDSMHSKSPNLTANICLVGKACIFLPTETNSSGISKNIKAEKRVKIKSFLEQMQYTGSVVIRTAATDLTDSEIEEDFVHLVNIWKKIKKNFQSCKVPRLLFQYDLLLNTLQNYSYHTISEVLVTDKFYFNRIDDYVKKMLIQFPKITYTKNVPFVNREFAKLYQHRFNLPSGGEIVIQPTEALVSIDVNSRRFTKLKTLEATAFNTNQEAVEAVKRQIFLKNLGGIIAVDFIDMYESENISKINKLLKDAFKDDKSSVNIVELNKFGVAHIIRERRDLSIFDKEFTKCPHCEGLSRLPNNNVVAMQLISQIIQYEHKTPLKVLVQPTIMQEILNNFSEHIVNRKIEWKIGEENKVEN